MELVIYPHFQGFSFFNTVLLSFAFSLSGSHKQRPAEAPERNSENFFLSCSRKGLKLGGLFLEAGTNWVCGWGESDISNSNNLCHWNGTIMSVLLKPHGDGKGGYDFPKEN